ERNPRQKWAGVYPDRASSATRRFRRSSPPTAKKGAGSLLRLPAPSTSGECATGRSGYARVLHLLRAVSGSVRDRGSAEPAPDLVKAFQIAVGQIRVPLTEVLDRLVHPMPLVILGSLQ